MRHIPLLLSLAILSGCATTRDYTPDFRPSQRDGLQLSRPINIALFDARTEKKDDIAQTLQIGIVQAYGKNARISPYFSPAPQGEVTVKIRILRVQSTFGSRLISVPVLLSSQSAAAAVATNGWGSVVAVATSSSQTLGTGFIAEGWWIGSSEMDVEVTDLSKGRNVKFVMPLVSETRESNMWGYASASSAARKAWKVSEQQFMRLLDDIFVKVSEDEKANKAPEPTPPLVTIRADARFAPSGVVAHL